MRAYAPGRFSLPTMASLVEAAHYTLKLAERAAAAGVQTAKARRKRQGGKKKGGDGDDDGGAVSDGGGEASGVGAGRVERPPPAEHAFEAAKFAGEFVHPAVIQVCAWVWGAGDPPAPF